MSRRLGGEASLLVSLVVLVLVIFALACDEPPLTEPDAGPPDTGPADTGMSGPMVPVPPAEPDFGACPPGWSPSADGPGCAPWELGARTTCADDEAWFVGEGACTRVGTECPVDGLPAEAGADALFVRAGAGLGGDGSRAAPFGTIGDALAVAEAGSVVAVGSGAYDELVDLPGGVTLLGACVGETVLSSSELRSDRGVVTVMGAGAAIRNLAIGESEQPGVWVVGEGRSVEVTDVAIRDVTIAGLDAERDASLRASNVTIRDVRAHGGGLFGRGVTIESRADASLSRVVVEGCREAAVIAFGDGVEIDLEDVAILKTEARSDGNAGVGIMTSMGGSVTGRRVVVDEATDVGISMRGGTMELSDLVIRGVRSRPGALDHGRGINVEASAEFRCGRCLVEDVRDGAIVALDPGSSLSLEDLVIRRVSSSEGPQLAGVGVAVQAGASAAGSRWLIEDTRESAIVVGGSVPCDAVFEDLTIRRTRPTEGLAVGGRALTIQTGSSLELQRALFEDSYDHGILATDPVTVRVTDLVVDTVSPSRSATGVPVGRGVSAQLGADVTLERVEIRDVWDVGVAAFSDATRVSVSDLRVVGVRTAECSGTGVCEFAPGGHGLGVYGGATLGAGGFRIGPTDVCGLHVADRGAVVLAGGEIREAAIGACVQSDNQRIEDLQEEVLYIDNVVSLQATTLPVPGLRDIEDSRGD